MKKTILLFLIVAFAATVDAQTSDKKWGVGAGLGAYGTFNESNIGVMPELYLSRYLSPKLDLMLKGDIGLWKSGLNSNLDLTNTSLNLRYKLSDENRNLRPYLYGGPGFLADNGSSGLNFDLGIGGKYYFNPSAAIYLEAGYLNGIEVTRGTKLIKDNIWKATIGIEFDLGKAKDEDMDGVSDKKDKCPSTPPGIKVDANGCPIDTDGDGVADYVDDCIAEPGLPYLNGCPDRDNDGIADKDDACPDIAGVEKLHGCPDEDSDGITDKDDKCPGTKKRWRVDTSGCPLDKDKDGIVDSEDDCPNTPSGVIVDTKGCPLDQDKDGVADTEDDCPTVAGTKENKGCPQSTEKEIIVPEITVEPIYFDYNKSIYKTGERSKINQIVSVLKTNSNYNVHIIGFTDSNGSEEYNKALSNRRINSVINTITSSGIKKSHITQQVSMGESNPKATNETAEGRAMNRRVEINIVKPK